MKNFLIGSILIISIFSINGMALDNTTLDNNIKITLSTKSLGTDKNWGTQKVLVNITTNRLGYLTYIEYYYSIGSNNNNPKLVSSNRYYDKDLTNNKISFEISRPKSSKRYSLIRSTILLDNKTVFEKWFSANKDYKWIADRLNNMTEPKRVPIVDSRSNKTINISNNSNRPNNSNISNNTTQVPKPNATVNISDINIPKPISANRPIIFGIIAISLIGLMVMAVYRTRKNK